MYTFLVMNYLSLFSGIGGFEKGIKNVDTSWECVGYSEIDKYAKSIYNYHYPKHKYYGDVTKINVPELPDFGLLVGGFPCQSFSIAGKRQGFKDTRGTLFFEIARILEAKKPEWLLLENVKGLLNHNGGETITTIFEILTELGYSVGWQVANSCHFGIPQNRERAFIVGHLAGCGGRAGEILPIRKDEAIFATATESEQGQSQTKLSTTLTGKSRATNTFVIKAVDTKQQGSPRYSDLSPTLRASDYKEPKKIVKAVLTPGRLQKRQQGRRFKENEEPAFTLNTQDRHGVLVDAEIRRLTPVEYERLQGFPDDWTKFGIIDDEKTEISDTQRYKTLGNAVTVNVIEAIISKIKRKCT